MRKTLWIILAVLIVAIGAPSAHADSIYVGTFTCDSPCASVPTSPEVTFPSAPGPTAPFSVTWDSIVFSNFQLPSGDLPTDTYTWGATTSFVGYGGPIFLINDASNSSDIVVYSSGGLGDFADGGGTLSFAPLTATPEPSSVALILAGVGFLLVTRKRIG